MANRRKKQAGKAPLASKTKSLRRKAPEKHIKSGSSIFKRTWVRRTILLAVIICGLVFFYINSLVRSRLESGIHNSGSAILSDTKKLRLSQKSDLADLNKALEERGYRKIALEKNDQARDKLDVGEYVETESALTLYRRSFSDVSGKTRAAEIETISFPQDRTKIAPSEIILEPQTLANLSTTESRVSTYLPIDKIPKHMQQAVLAIEDSRFYSHFGIDPIGIARAFVTNISAGRMLQGGSTITQQLAKNLFFSSKKTILRKLLEIPASISLEVRLSKDKILEMYLNEVYLGQDGSVAIHGIAAASKVFFGKSVQELSIPEAALLAGIIQAPSAYAPRRFLSKAAARKNQVLLKMKEFGYISEQQYKQTKSQKIKIVSDFKHKKQLPFYISSLRERLAAEIELDLATQKGITVNTGLEPWHQECAEDAIAAAMKKIEQSNPALARKKSPIEAALVAIEPFSGKIKAWVGGRDFSRSQFDRVSKPSRQIGSTVKPFVYLTALDGSLNSYKTATAISVLKDQEFSLKLPNGSVWSPQNYDNKFRGDVTLRYALENSLNIPAVSITQKYGIKSLTKTLQVLNLKEEIKDLPSVALGALDTNLLSLTAAYSALANGGVYIEPRLFTSVVDSDGNQLMHSDINERRIAAEGPTFVLTSILEGAVERGTGNAIRKLGYVGPAAGKTGTTNDARDAWFVGYTPELAVGVWLGFDDNKKIGLTGGQAAAPIWGEFMKCVSKYHKFEDFIAPPSVQLLEIDPLTGLLFNEDCPNQRGVKEYFVNGTEPKFACRPGVMPAQSEISEPEPKRRKKSLWDDLFG
jgi:penicillin-binding protein 1B